VDTNSSRLDDPKFSRDIFFAQAFNESSNQEINRRGCNAAGKAQNDNAGIFFRWILKGRGKIHIQRDQAAAFRATIADQFAVRRLLHLLFRDGGRIVSRSNQAGLAESPQILVELESHAAGSRGTAT